MRARTFLVVVALLTLRVFAGAATPQPAITLPISELVAGPAKPIAIAPDGSWIAFVGIGGIGDADGAVESGRVQVWNLKTGTLDRSFATPGAWRDEVGVVVSPDARWLAYTRHVDYKGGVQLHDFRTGKVTHTIRDLGSESLAVGFSADGKELYTATHPGNGGKRVVAWSTADGSKLRTIEVTKYDRVTLSPDGKTLHVNPSRDNDHQELWDVTTGKKLSDLGRPSVHGKPTFLRGGKELTLLFDYYVGQEYRVWEVGTDKKHTAIKMPGKAKDPIGYAISDDLSATASLEYYGDLRVHDAGKAEPRFTFSMKAPLGKGPIFTPDGKRVLVVHPYERAWVLDATTGKPAFTLEADYRAVKSLAFTADGKSLIAGVAYWPKLNGNGSSHPPDGFLMTWDTATGELKRAANGVNNFLSAVYPSANGEKAMVVTAEYSNQAEWWDLKTGKRLKILSDPDAGVHSFGASADGKKFGGVRYEYTVEPNGGKGGRVKDVRLWDLATGEVLTDLAKTTSEYPLRFTPDGKVVLLRESGFGVRAHPTAGGKPVTIWSGTGDSETTKHPEQPVPLPDGESFVAYHTPRQYAERQLYVYDIGRQIKFGEVDQYTGPLAVSPNGKWVAAGGQVRDKRNPVYLWKVPELGPLDEKQLAAGKILTSESKTKRITLEGHLGEVFAVAFSPDGKTLATGGRDKIIRLWDVETGTLKASLWAAPPADPASAPGDWVAFTSDGTHAGTARGRAFLRFADADGAKLFSAEKVQQALRAK